MSEPYTLCISNLLFLSDSQNEDDSKKRKCESPSEIESKKAKVTFDICDEEEETIKYNADNDEFVKNIRFLINQNKEIAFALKEREKNYFAAYDGWTKNLASVKKTAGKNPTISQLIQIQSIEKDLHHYSKSSIILLIESLFVENYNQLLKKLMDEYIVEMAQYNIILQNNMIPPFPYQKYDELFSFQTFHFSKYNDYSIEIIQKMKANHESIIFQHDKLTKKLVTCETDLAKIESAGISGITKNFIQNQIILNKIKKLQIHNVAILYHKCSELINESIMKFKNET